MITDILDNIDDSYGIMLKLEREEIYKILLFASSDNQEANLRPKLDITYTITQ